LFDRLDRLDRLDRAGSVALNSDLVVGAGVSWTPATDTPSSNSSWTSTSE